MSKVVHLSDQAHHKAKAYCHTRGLKMSEWVASLIDRATGDKLDTDASDASSAHAKALEDVASINHAVSAPSLRNHAVEGGDVAPYQALVQKKKIAPTAAPVQNLAEGATPIYEAPPFWAR